MEHLLIFAIYQLRKYTRSGKPTPSQRIQNNVRIATFVLFLHYVRHLKKLLHHTLIFPMKHLEKLFNEPPLIFEHEYRKD